MFMLKIFQRTVHLYSLACDPLIETMGFILSLISLRVSYSCCLIVFFSFNVLTSSLLITTRFVYSCFVTSYVDCAIHIELILIELNIIIIIIILVCGHRCAAHSQCKTVYDGNSLVEKNSSKLLSNLVEVFFSTSQ